MKLRMIGNIDESGISRRRSLVEIGLLGLAGVLLPYGAMWMKEMYGDEINDLYEKTVLSRIMSPEALTEYKLRKESSEGNFELWDNLNILNEPGNRKLMIGDSQVIHCTWGKTDIIARVNVTLKNLYYYCKENTDLQKKQYDHIYLWASADLWNNFDGFSRKRSYSISYRIAKKRASYRLSHDPELIKFAGNEDKKKSLIKEEQWKYVRERTLTPEKYEQVHTDFRNLADYLKDNFNGPLRIISPFPHYAIKNLPIISRLSQQMSEEYPHEYRDVNGYFFDSNGNFMVREMFGKDGFHLSVLGYNRLLEILDSMENLRERPRKDV